MVREEWIATFSLDESFACCPFDAALANATAAPSMASVNNSFLDFFVAFENAGSYIWRIFSIIM